VSISLKSKTAKGKPGSGKDAANGAGVAAQEVAKPAAAFTLARVVGTKPYLPQVNLLPPSIVAKRALQRLKRLLLLLLLLVVVIAVGLYAWSALDAKSAHDQLQASQQENARLLREQAKYAEVPKIIKQISLVDNARIVGMGNEVAWSGYIAQVQKALPKDAVLQSMTATIQSPIAAAPSPVDPLQTQGIGMITLVHRSLTVPDAAQWLDSLSKITGFVDPLYSTAESTSDDGTAYYDVTTTVQLTSEALSGRFLTIEDEAK